MKRRFITTLLSIVSVLCLSLGLSACARKNTHEHTFSDDWSSDANGHWHDATCEHTDEKSEYAAHTDENNDGYCDVCNYYPLTVTVGGTYYYCENDILDDLIYIDFRNGKWTDDEGVTGDYVISGATVTLNMTIENETTEFATGTVNGDDITLDILGADIVYRKGEDISNKPKEKTLSYKLSDDRTYYIVKGIGGLTGDIEIPDEYKRKPVKEIAENAFANAKELTSIVIGNNVTSLGNKAFYNCTNLIEAVVGESVTAIPDSAFEGCNKLVKITLGSDIKSFGEKAFYSCLALNDVYYNGTVSNWAQIDFTSNPICDKNIYIVGNNTARPEYPNRNFYIGGEILKYVNITEATYISEMAFFGAVQIENVTIGGKVKTVGENAFNSCSALKTLNVTGGVKSIGKAAFRFCNNLISVVLSDSVKTIGESAFDTCENLTAVNTGNGVSYIAKGAFMACDKLATLTLGSSVAEICEGAFYSCESLTTVTIPSSTIFIGKDAFSYTGLASAIFKSTTGWVANKTDALTSEQLSDTANAARLLITSVLDKGYAEAEWEKPTLTYSLSSDKTYYIVNNSGTVSRSIIEIPEKYNEKPVRALAQNAFKDCKSLISLSLPGCMLNIPTSAFSGCTSLENITVRGYLVSDYEEVYASADGVLYNADFTQLIYMPLAKTEITLTGVKEIAESRFESNESLKKVIIGDSVESIGYRAFLGCKNLSEITIPASVTSIGEYAFNGCNNLKINYKGSLSDWCNLTINSRFPDGTELYISDEKVTNLVIPKDITKINDYVFSGISGITSVTLHSNLVEIGNYAFSTCRSLAEVTIPSTVEKIDDYAFGGCNALVVYCEVSERPNEWSYDWESEANVVWDCKNRDVDKNGYTYIVVDGIRYALQDGVAIVSKQMSEISRTVTIPENITSKGITYKVKEIESYAFERSSIKSITIPSTITKIGQYAFSECAGLTKLTLPTGLTDIGACAFKNCKGITEITLPTSLESVGSDSFDGCPVVKATVPTIAIPYLDKDNLKSIIITSGKNVTGLKNCTTLTSVTLADGIESIGGSAFYGCTNITEITLPNSILSIGSEAFRDCNNLKTLSFSNQLTNIADSAFSGCINLAELKLSNSLTNIGANAFSGCVKLDNVIIPNSVSFIGNSAFSGCTNLADIKLPDVAVTIGRDVFERTAYFADENNWLNGVLYIDKHLIIAHDLSGSVAINAGTLSIAANAFTGSESLTSVILPESVGVIGSGAFMNCIELISVNIPDNVTTIASNTFNGCVKLENLTVSKNITEIGNSAFAGCTALTCFVVPDGVTVISGSVFSGCVNLISLTLPDKLNAISDDAFYDCSSLKDITIPVSVKSIGSGAFENCVSITEIIIPEGVTEIEYDTFNHCNNLSNVTIPKSVKEISQTAFNACYALENVYFNGDIAGWCDMRIHYYFASPLRYTKNFYIDGELVENLVIPETVKKIKEYTFDACDIFKSVTIPETVEIIEERAFQSVNCVIYCEAVQRPNGWNKDWAIYSDKIVWDYKNNEKDENGYSHIEFDGLRFAIKDGEAIVSTHPRNLKGEFIISDSITYKNVNYKVIGIGENAFNDCSDITSVTIKASIKSICARAFAGCSSLVEITIPSSVEKIEYDVFNECTNLKKIYWNAISCERGDDYGNSTFGKCEKLNEVVFGNEVTAIGENIFSNCNGLKSITIPENITHIGRYAFSSCNSLSEITLHNNITYLGYGAFSSTAYVSDENNWQNGVLYIGKYLIDAKNSIEGSYEILPGTLFICEEAFIGCNKLSSLIIPNSLKAIGDKAFWGCSNLTSITIPESVIQIGDSVFINSRISYINFTGTISQLNVVEKGEDWNRSGTGTILVECSDGYYEDM